MYAKILLLVLVAVVVGNPVADKPDPRLMQNPNRIQGDIAGYVAKPRNAVSNDYFLWPNRIIYYEIAPYTYTQAELAVISQGMNEIAARTCLRFAPRTATSQNYISIFNGVGDEKGCWSFVGKRGNMQRLSLSKQGCVYKGTVMHELLHAAGFDHEHNRSDRDRFIQVNWQNINKQMANNFDPLAASQNRLFTDFDYSSIMIYGEYAFSNNGQKSMMPRQAGASMAEPYTKFALSPKDVISINRLYNC